MRLPWWDERETKLNFHRNIAAAHEQIQRMPATGRMDMEARAFVLTVMVSCQAENMPAHVVSLEEICTFLMQQYSEILQNFPRHRALKHTDMRYFCDCEHAWPWKHFLLTCQSFHIRAACFAQMKQHLKALMFLCIYNTGKSIDVALFKTAHVILMQGYLLHDSIGISLGMFRNNALYADTSAAMIHESVIASNVKDMLHRLQGEDERLPPADTHTTTSDGLWHRRPLHTRHNLFEFPERCASFLHDMTHIQPFHAGNETMCRLFMAFFMVAHDGFPFPVPIAPITERSSQEFLHALSTPDNHRLQLHEDPAAGFRREKALLSAYILECVWGNMEELINV